MKKPILLTIVLVIIILGGIAGLGYPNMSIEEPQLVRATPEVNTGVAAMTEAGGRLLLGDVLGAAGRVIKGLDMVATVDVINDSPVPLYVPSTDHTLIFNGATITGPVTVEGGILSAGDTMVLAIAAFIPAERLPEPLLVGLLNGGNFELEVVTTLSLDPFQVIERDFAFSISATDALKEAILGSGG